MDVSHDNTIREIMEECARLQSGLGFPQEKRRRTVEESPSVTKMDYKTGPQWTKRAYIDGGND